MLSWLQFVCIHGFMIFASKNWHYHGNLASLGLLMEFGSCSTAPCGRLSFLDTIGPNGTTWHCAQNVLEENLPNFRKQCGFLE